MNKCDVRVNQVLLFRDPINSGELGEALWAATKEVDNFYNLDEQRVCFRRNYLSAFPRDALQSAATADAGCRPKNGAVSLFAAPASRGDQLDNAESAVALLTENSTWKEAEGQLVRRYDQNKIRRLVGELVGALPGEKTVIIADLMLTAKPQWLYQIWDGDDTGAVISIPSTDPKFWRLPAISDRDRIAIIKHRVRTAFLSIVGGFTRLKRCQNERCFLFTDVDSVTSLDGMVLLGPEHKLATLSNRGFEVFPKDPTRIQPIKEKREER